MAFECDFECKKCDKEFTVDWDYGDEVTCPHCGTVWETDYEENWDFNMSGPWLGNEVTPSAPATEEG